MQGNFIGTEVTYQYFGIQVINVYNVVNFTCVPVFIDISLQAQNIHSIPWCGHNPNKSMWAGSIKIP